MDGRPSRFRDRQGGPGTRRRPPHYVRELPVDDSTTRDIAFFSYAQEVYDKSNNKNTNVMRSIRKKRVTYTKGMIQQPIEKTPAVQNREDIKRHKP